MLIMPGPGVLSAAAVGASYGARSGARYLAGLWLGNFTVSLIVISGLWTLLEALPNLRVVLSVCSLAYFIYLAIKIALASSEVGFGLLSKAPSFAEGVVLQLVNPKAYAANAFLFTNFAMYPGEWALEMGAKILVSNAIWIPMHIAWLQVGVWLKRLNLPHQVQRRINWAMAALMVFVVVLAALELF